MLFIFQVTNYLRYINSYKEAGTATIEMIISSGGNVIGFCPVMKILYLILYVSES